MSEEESRQATPGPPLRVAILLLPDFPLMAFSALVEPLRAANLLGREAYRCLLVSPEGGDVPTSSGVSVRSDVAAAEAPPVDRALVCSGGNAHAVEAPAAMAWLRRLARRGCGLGAVADASFFLARAGLLEGYACTIHWQSQAAFAERFPEIELRPELYVIDRDRYTSAGGIGAFDLSLDLIERDCGAATALQVAQWFVHERLRSGADREALALRLRTGLHDQTVLMAIAAMERRLERPLRLAALAAELGLSRDTLERRFRRATGRSPGQYYLGLRLRRAEDCLRHTTMAVAAVAQSCGFADASAFAKSFKAHHGVSPSAFRRRQRRSPPPLAAS